MTDRPGPSAACAPGKIATAPTAVTSRSRNVVAQGGGCAPRSRARGAALRMPRRPNDPVHDRTSSDGGGSSVRGQRTPVSRAGRNRLKRGGGPGA